VSWDNSDEFEAEESDFDQWQGKIIFFSPQYPTGSGTQLVYCPMGMGAVSQEVK
jgi:hypothetical protein